MRGKNDRLVIVMILIILILFTLACFVEGDSYVRGVTPTRVDGLSFEIAGTVIDTWSWGEGDPVCDVQDEMSLSVAADNSVKMILRGPCLFLSCTPSESSLPCGFVMLGTYDREKDQVTFFACNDINDRNGSGMVQLYTNALDEHMVDNGEAACSFASEEHTIKFIAP